MLVKIFVLLLTVWQVFAKTSFIEEGNRAKIFELTDNEVPIFRVTLPKGQFEQLKEAVQVPFNGNSDSIERIIKALKGEYVAPKVPLKQFKTKEATLTVEINGYEKLKRKKSHFV
ncbi:hypothetical protein PIROE2DRAFT_61549 [Piromyces sp. E2]|nr:hypothetical protein PIROE2DRAFT_61549 [Piromyces sp. E2]|eukprot:OUM62998.1 hypothetical protein PIROE2DRAFT_61549 [Piromyces sp. E2]